MPYTGFITTLPPLYSSGDPNYPVSTSYTYNSDGTVATQTDTVGTQTKSYTFAYNTDGTVLSVTTLFLGHQRVETYTYNSDGTVASMSATDTQLY